MIELNATVVLPTMGKSHILSHVLKSIDQQKFSGNLEVILIVNHPSEIFYKKICELVLSLNRIYRVEWIPHFGVNRARNLGLQMAQNELVFFLDDDCLVDNSLLLDFHVKAHQESDLFAAGGGYAIRPDASFWGRVYQVIQMQWLYSGLYQVSSNLTSHLIGGHFSIKKSMCYKLGFKFSEEIVYGGSELEFFLIAHRHHLKMRLFDWVVLHCPEIDFLILVKKIFKQGRGKAIAEKHGCLDTSASEAVEDFVEKNNFFTKVFVQFFQIIFWFGFYHEQKKYMSFVRLVVLQMKNSFLSKKYSWLQNVNRIEQFKKQSGDRF